MNYLELLPYAQTEHQQKVLGALAVAGSQGKAAAALGMTPGGVFSALRKVRATAARRGYSPEHGNNHPIPETECIRGHSTLRRGDGSVVLQWQKTASVRTYEAIEEIVESVSAGLPVATPALTWRRSARTR